MRESQNGAELEVTERNTGSLMLGEKKALKSPNPAISLAQKPLLAFLVVGSGASCEVSGMDRSQLPEKRMNIVERKS